MKTPAPMIPERMGGVANCARGLGDEDYTSAVRADRPAVANCARGLGDEDEPRPRQGMSGRVANCARGLGDEGPGSV